METRQCGRCGLIKPVERFDFADKKDGHRRRTCQECEKIKRRERVDAFRAENPEHPWFTSPETVKKLCNKCGESKALTEFNKNISRIDGRHTLCAKCTCETERGIRRRTVRLASRARYYQEKKNEDPKAWQTQYWARAMKKNYGLTVADFENMMLAQGEKCGICGVHQSSLKVRLAIDHCHKTKRIRGLLCRSCNSGIALLKENKGSLLRAIEYLGL